MTDETNTNSDNEVILCQECGIKIKEFGEVYHTTGIVNGKLDGHIHLCRSCMYGLLNNNMTKITSPEIKLARVKQQEMPLVKASITTRQFVPGYLNSQINDMLR